jgi:hypothetical protein
MSAHEKGIKQDSVGGEADEGFAMDEGKLSGG